MNLKNRIIALVTASAVAVPAIAYAKHELANKEGPVVNVTGKLSVGLTGFPGVAKNLTMTDDDKDLTFTVNMNEMKTGMDMRDKHFRERVVKTKNMAVLKVSKDQVKGKTSGTVNGTLTLNDKAKPVKVKWSKLQDAGNLMKVEAMVYTGSLDEDGKGFIKYTDWGIKEQCEAFVCVKPDVAITAKFWTTKE